MQLPEILPAKDNTPMTPVSLLVALGACAIAAPRDAGTAIVYSRDVRPILSNYCFRCHGPDSAARQADLRLDQRGAAIDPRSSGQPAIQPGHPEASELMARLTTSDPELMMPPAGTDKRPTAAEIDTLRRWIMQEAPYAEHWSYVVPVRPQLPVVSTSEWPLNPIDHFILSRLDQESLRPSPPTDRHSWLRRASIDLTGLPPTPAEADAFAQDTRVDAYEQAVDRLLASPAYGERWAAIWLDLARYGDSAGYIHDPPREIWRWRDWLLKAHNENMPFDQMTIEMLAGDLLPDATNEQVIATGFHRNTTTNTEGGSSAAEYHFAALVDRVNTTMQVWMGSTFACAQCHHHKYDPISQQDYYQVLAIFNSTEDFNSETPALSVARMGQDDAFQALTPQVATAQQQLATETSRVDGLQTGWETSVDRSQLPADVLTALEVAADKRDAAQKDLLAKHHRQTDTQWVAADAEARRLRSALDEVSTTTLVMKAIPPRPSFVAIRGEWQSQGETVQPAAPAAWHRPATTGPLDRLGFARWLVDPQNPLTARVAVNRLWQEVFGIGLVESSEEFGMQGDPPSHPELLDWLATEYVRLGWDNKQLLKLLVTSATYRQISRVTPELMERDPANRWLARGPRVRLSAEAMRDQALAVSGLLSNKLYGPPVHPFQPVNGLAAAFGQSTDWETSSGEDRYRRALYTRWRRNLPYPSMVAFDAPERAVCSARRVRTNTPLQALVTLNDPVFVEAAQALARRIMREGGDSAAARATFGFRTVLTRQPTDQEVQRLVRLLEQSLTKLATDPQQTLALATEPLGELPDGVDPVEAAAWTVVANVLLNLDETITKR